MDRLIKFTSSLILMSFLLPFADLSVVEAESNGWISVGPNGGSPVLEIIYHPSNPQIVYLVSEYGFYVSSNGGTDWQLISGIFPDLNSAEYPKTFSLDIDPINTNTIFVGTSRGVYKSEDSGLTWFHSSQGLPPVLSSYYYNVTINPIENNILYVATQIGVYKSVDYGVNWDYCAFSGDFAEEIFIDPQDTSRIYAEIIHEGLWKSLDDGSSWMKIGLPLTTVGKFTLDNDSPGTLYISGSLYEEKRMLRSIDYGVNWERIDSAPDMSISGIEIDPNNSDLIYIVGYGGCGIFKSEDRGVHWKQIPSGYPWVEYENIISIAMNPENNMEIMVGGQFNINQVIDGGVLKTTDGGDNFYFHNNGYANQTIKDLVFDPNNENIVYVGTARGVYKSIDRGLSWVSANSGMPLQSSGLNSPYVWNLMINPLDSNIIYANTTYYGVYKSTDGGDNWVELNSGMSTQQRKLYIDPHDPTILFAGCFDGLYRITNSGDDWTLITLDEGLLTFAFHPNNPDVIFASSYQMGYKGLFKSTDNGFSWIKISELPYGYESLIINPTNPSIIYAASYLFSGVFKSVDEGLSWTPSGLYGKRVIHLSLHPIYPQILYAVVQDRDTNIKQIFYSQNGGEQWSLFDGGLTEFDPVRFSINPIDPTRYYLGTYTKSVFMNDWGEGMVDLDVSTSEIQLVDFSFLEPETNSTKDNQPEFSSVQTIVSNRGLVDAIDVTVSLWLGEPSEGQVLDQKKVPIVRAGGNELVIFNISGQVEGDLYVQAIADPMNMDPFLFNNVSSGTPVLIDYVDYHYDPDTYYFTNRRSTTTDLMYFNSINPYGVLQPFKLWMFILTSSGGYCLGISETSIFYHDGQMSKPLNKTTYELSWDEAFYNIATRQFLAMPITIYALAAEKVNPDFTSPGNAYRKIHDNLISDNFSPMILNIIYGSDDYKHAVVAYKIIELGDSKYVYVYDSNSPMDTNDRLGSPDYFTLDSTEDIFITGSYGDVNRAFAIEPSLDYDYEQIYETISNFLMEELLEQNYATLIYHFGGDLSANMTIASENEPSTFYLTDENGNRIGIDNEVYVNEIVGAIFEDLGGVFNIKVPAKHDYTLTMLGTGSYGGEMIVATPMDQSNVLMAQFPGLMIPFGVTASLSFGPSHGNVNIQLDDGTYIDPENVTWLANKNPLYFPFIRK